MERAGVETKMDVIEISVDDIDDDAQWNCRGFICAFDVEGLAKDISEKGLLQPIMVRKIADNPKPYRAVAGFSRLMAIKSLGWKVIPAIVKDVNERDAAILNLTENVVRKNLNMLQEAKAVQRLLEMDPTLTQERIGEKLQQSRGWAQMRSYIIQLPEEAHDPIAKGMMTYDHIRAIWGMSKREDQLAAIKKIKEARERGEKVNLNPPPKKSIDIKHPRSRSEIFAMQDHIQANLGNNLATRCLAWASGEIVDREIFGDIAIIMEAEEKSYEIPTEALPATRM